MQRHYFKQAHNSKTCFHCGGGPNDPAHLAAQTSQITLDYCRGYIDNPDNFDRHYPGDRKEYQRGWDAARDAKNTPLPIVKFQLCQHRNPNVKKVVDDYQLAQIFKRRTIYAQQGDRPYVVSEDGWRLDEHNLWLHEGEQLVVRRRDWTPVYTVFGKDRHLDRIDPNVDIA